MAKFEIFIPAVKATEFNMTVRITADTWMAALKAGMVRIGDTSAMQNILVDVHDDSIHVTEPVLGRVFRIRELADDAPAAAPPPPVAPPVVAAPVPPAPVLAVPAPVITAPVRIAQPPVQAPVIAAVPKAPPVQTAAAPPIQPAPARAPATPPAQSPQEPPRVAAAATDVLGRPPIARLALQRRAVTADEPQVVTERSAPTPRPDIGRQPSEVRENPIEDRLALLFEQAQEVHAVATTAKEAAAFFMDLAMKVVPAESGAVFLADIDREDLYFAAARGPKASQVMGFRVPMGTGIVGFSALYGVTLAVSDVEKDKRFYAAISQKIGYPTHSIACAPVQKDGRVFGAIELINRQNGARFGTGELQLLTYLSERMADYLEAELMRD